jgi:site-specific DNA-methyltransferase (adenine-specific)
MQRNAIIMKKYQIIYADPAWSYSDQGCQGTMANHYKGMKLEDIKKLPVGGVLADKNCVLFMWATYPMLKEALEVIEAWGFTYKSIAFQWIKLNKKNGQPFYGLGRWTRGNTEPCLLATKGRPKRISSSVFQLIQSPLTRHSAKPPIVREKIVELMGDLPRIELFARKEDTLFQTKDWKGWDVWGNESGSDIKL